MQMADLMRELGFLSDATSEKDKIRDIWSILDGDSNNGILALNLKVFLSAIGNFDYPWMRLKNTDEESDKNDIGKFIGKDWRVSKKDIEWIHKTFG